jgi:hypothetical protein
MPYSLPWITNRCSSLQLADRSVALRQQLENSDPNRISERLDELGLQLIQRRRHAYFTFPCSNGDCDSANFVLAY